MRSAESLEGGLNRNSNPQAITTARHAYDRFLAKFPLLFGYWKKYADMEFSITGTEAAEMVRHTPLHMVSLFLLLCDPAPARSYAQTVPFGPNISCKG